METLVHQHTIFQGQVTNKKLKTAPEDVFIKFLTELVEEIGMHILIPPQVVLSKHNAWTGLVGIVTSHISFHYWIDLNYVQIDIYSCKPYDDKKALAYIEHFWETKDPKILLINRELGKTFDVKEG